MEIEIEKGTRLRGVRSLCELMIWDDRVPELIVKIRKAPGSAHATTRTHHHRGLAWMEAPPGLQCEVMRWLSRPTIRRRATRAA